MRHGAAASRRRERTHHWTGHRRAWRSFGVSLGRKTEDRWIGRPAPADSLTPLKRWCQSEQPCACRTRDCPLMIGSRMPQQFEAPQRRLSRARRGCTAMSAICAARCPAPVRGSAAAESKWTAPQRRAQRTGKFVSGRQELVSCSAPVRRTGLLRVAGPHVSPTPRHGSVRPAVSTQRSRPTAHHHQGVFAEKTVRAVLSSSPTAAVCSSGCLCCREAEIQVEVSGSGSAPSSKLWTSSTKLQRRQYSTSPRQHLYITCLFLNCNSPIHLLAFWQPRLLE